MSGMRVASHIHSAFSDDCDWPLVRIVRLLRRLGYHGAMVCEHDRGLTDAGWDAIRAECRRISRSGFLVVPGVEYQDPTHTVHVPVYGDIPFLGQSPHVADVLAYAEREGAVSVLAHPARRDAFAAIEDAWLERATGVEVWSRKYDGLTPNRWAVEACRRHDLVPFVALDFHGPRQLFPLAMTLCGPSVSTPEDLVAAIHTRALRASAAGLEPSRLLTGKLGAALNQAERLRRTIAPGIRRLEAWRPRIHRRGQRLS